MSLGPHARPQSSFVWTTVLYGILMTHRFQQRSAARAAAPAGNNKQANSTSPEEEVHLNDLPQFSSMHFPVVLQLLAIVIGFFFLCMTRGQRVGHSEHIYLAEGSHVTLHAKRCWLPWRGEAATRRLCDGSGSIAVDKWEIDRPNDRGNCFALWRYCYYVSTKVNFR